MEMFEWHFGTSGVARQRRDAAWINWLGLAKYSD
jgi:hypothetical protein